MQSPLKQAIVPSDDGCVHLAIEAVLEAPMQHLVTSLDDEGGVRFATDACGRSTDISGYTEWTCETLPFVSLGWDWRIDYRHAPARWVRVGLPRTNVRLIDAERGPLQWQQNLEAMAEVVDAIDWQPCACAAVMRQHS